ncbi:MAG: glycosyltransferase [Anaerolineae bacterium]
MRVVIVSKAFVIGAYQTKLEAIAAQDGVELTAIAPPFWREGGRVQALERDHVAGYRLAVIPMALNGSFHLHFYPTLARILRETRPDICHIDEEPYNLATYLALRAARTVGARTLFFTWQNLLRRYPWPFRALERYTHTHADAAIAGTQDAADVLRHKGYSGPLRVIPQFGVDPERFRPLPRPEADATPFEIVYAGRLVEQKGLGVLVEALAGLEGDWRLTLYAAGPMEAELRAQLASMGLSQRVAFHGHVPSSEMPSRLAAAHALVLPSLTRPNWKEQFGRVLVEAMACGVVVVGSNSGEIARVIGDGGLVFPEGDATALRDCLSRLMADPDLRRVLAEHGRARVLAHFTQQRIAEETVALYRDLAAGRLA